MSKFLFPKNKFLFVIILFSLYSASFKPAYSQVDPQYWITGSINCGFEVKIANFIISYSDQHILKEAIVTRKKGDFADSLDYFVATNIFLPEDLQQVDYVVQAEGENSANCIVSFPGLSSSELKLRSDYHDNLRQAVVVLRNSSATLKQSLSKVNASLARLKQDASQIANLNVIATAQNQEKQYQDRIRMLRADLERLNTFLSNAKNQTAPRSFVKRQAELTTQLEELTKLGKSVEDSEYSRKHTSEEEKQKNLSMIEEARYENVEELKKELVSLRKQRANLESQSQTNNDINQPEEYLPQ